MGGRAQGAGRGFRASRLRLISVRHLAGTLRLAACRQAPLRGAPWDIPGHRSGFLWFPSHSQAQHTGCSGVARPRGLPLGQHAGGFSEGGRGGWQPGGGMQADPSLSPHHLISWREGKAVGPGRGPSFATSWLVTRDKQHSSRSPSEDGNAGPAGHAGSNERMKDKPSARLWALS